MTSDAFPSICVFDVNETLLDIEFLAPLFRRLFGDENVLREWFGQLVLYSESITLSGPYTPFFTLGQGVLKMLGSIHTVSIREADIQELRQSQDPLDRTRERLELSDDEAEALEREVEELVEGSVAFAKAATDPKPEDALKNVYA